jgi:hypothetical protein
VGLKLALLITAPTLTRPALGVVVGSGVIALILAGTLWWLIGHAITISHEGGHALAAVLFGGKVNSVRVRRDRTGRTSADLLPLTGVFFTMAGYMAPSAFGLFASLLIALGQFLAVLWVTLVLLALILTVASTWFTRFAVTVTGLVVVLALHSHSTNLVLWTACIWAWILLIGGLVHVILHNGIGADHHALKRATWIPVWVWSLLFTAFAVAALGIGLSWLTGIDSPLNTS